MVDMSLLLVQGWFMKNFAFVVLIAAAVAVAVGVLTGLGLPGFIIGVTLALVLWVMLFVGSQFRSRGASVPAAPYAMAAVAAVAIGYLVFRIGDENPAFWSVGFIMAGAITSVIPRAGVASAQKN